MVTFLLLVLMTRKDVMLMSPWNCISQNVLLLDLMPVFHFFFFARLVQEGVFSLLLSKCCGSEVIQEVFCVLDKHCC